MWHADAHTSLSFGLTHQKRRGGRQGNGSPGHQHDARVPTRTQGFSVVAAARLSKPCSFCLGSSIFDSHGYGPCVIDSLVDGLLMFSPPFLPFVEVRRSCFRVSWPLGGLLEARGISQDWLDFEPCFAQTHFGFGVNDVRPARTELGSGLAEKTKPIKSGTIVPPRR